MGAGGGRMAKMKETRAGRRLDALLDEAERAGSLLAPGENRDVAACVRRVRAHALVAPVPGLFARRAWWAGLSPAGQSLALIRAFAARHPDWVFCGTSAALVHGLSVSYGLIDRVHVVAGETASSRGRRGVVRHRTSGDIACVEVDGVRVTPLMATVADCLRSCTLREGLPIADSALRAMDVPADAFLAVLAACVRGKAGCANALMIARHADGLSESGGESLARAVILEEGFQAPELQVTFDDPLEPGRVIRVDMLFRLPDGRLVACEVDGLGKYHDPGMLNGRTTEQVILAERRRESHINALGIPVARLPVEKLEVTGFVARTLEAFGIPRPVEAGERCRPHGPSAAEIVRAFNAHEPVP